MARAHKQNVEVASNQGGEATNGTAQDGNDKPLENTSSVPQNDQDSVETTPAENETAKEADERRTKEEFKFADESNPNQKARNAGAEDEFDQDGNPRTGGYSYGVAPDDTRGTVPEPANRGSAPNEASVNSVPAEDRLVNLNGNQNAAEWSDKDQRKLEKELSTPEKGIMARVTTSVGDYVKVKFFKNNKPMGTYTSRKFDKQNAKKHLKNLQ